MISSMHELLLQVCISVNYHLTRATSVQLGFTAFYYIISHQQTGTRPWDRLFACFHSLSVVFKLCLLKTHQRACQHFNAHLHICAKQSPYLLTCSCFLFCLSVEVAFDTLFVACGPNVKDDICSLFRAAFTFSPSPYWTHFHNPANAHAAIGAVSVLFSFLSMCSGTMVVNFGLFRKRK